MDSSAPQLELLPRPLRIAAITLFLAAVAAGGYVFRDDFNAVMIIIGGAAAIALLLVGYGAILRWRRRRRGKPLERAIIGNSASLPMGISEPARRAALDDLRKKFETGVSKFRAAGKDLYSLPWYVLVGEPGGGKTEAIRHCNVGFPPGLQDYTQGSGGTLNMNWWFTNHAIILDTAGRLMFEEVAPGSSNEWTEFMKLLTRARPACPVNGMLLVIPVDSLITDSADKIEKKAARIAQQLDQIQRLLGVRFPVFVVVTKCDLINGFREFFDNLTDPQLQHQMLGWSNPAQLDQPFNPEQVDQHLLAVRGRLLRRRQALLLDPVNTEDRTARRLDQVDAVYGFPDTFMKITPRLRRYLEMIFVAGEWSPKPLFLRGIYFTSSMREGIALDAELAEALSVPVESLKSDGRSWERERAYFLRDLFMTKVFREKGLVTRASNTKRLQRRRKVLVMGTGIVSVVALLAITWTGAMQLRQSIGRQSNYWMAVNASWHDRRNDWEIVQPLPGSPGNYTYNGFREMNLGETRPTLGQVFADAATRSGDQIKIPWVFRPQAMLRGDLNDRKRQAYRSIFQTSVVRCLVDAARGKLQADKPENWSPYAGDAMAELLRLEVVGAGLPPAKSEAQNPATVTLDPLLRFVLSDDDYLRYKAEQRQALQDGLDWISAETSPGQSDVATQVFAADSPNARRALDTGVASLSKYWEIRLNGGNHRLADVRAVQAAVEKFQSAERALSRQISADATGSGPTTLETYKKASQAFQAQLAQLQSARGTADAALAKLEKDTAAGKSLLALYQIEVDRDIEAAMRAHERLMQLVPRTAPAGSEAKVPQHLLTLRQRLIDESAKFPRMRSSALPEDLQNDLSRIDRLYLSTVKAADGRDQRTFDRCAQIYASAKAQLDAAEQTASLSGSAKVALGQVDADAAAAAKQIDQLAADSGDGASGLQDAAKAARTVAGWAAKYRRFLLLKGSAAKAPRDAAGVAALVSGGATTRPAPKWPLVLNTSLQKDETFDPRFAPASAREVLLDWTSVASQLNQTNASVLEREQLAKLYEPARNAPALYLADYQKYWTETVPARLKVAVAGWDGFFRDGAQPRNWKAWEVNATLKDVTRQILDALAQVDDAAKFLDADRKLQAARAAFQSSLDQFDESLLLRECDRILVNWRSLARDSGYDPVKAREALLDLKPEAWRDQFLFSGQMKGVVVAYWSDVSAELTSALSKAAAAREAGALGQAMNSLKQYDHFPLALPRKSDPALTIAQVAEARKLVDQISRMAAQSADAAGTATVGRTIRQGGMTGEESLDRQLNELRGQALSARDSRWLDQLKRQLDSVVQDAPQTCAVRVPGDVERASLPADWQPRDTGYYSVALVQDGEGAGNEVQITPLPDKPQLLGACKYPGGAIHLGFYRTPTHDRETPGIVALTPGAPWQGLSLLFVGSARPIRDSDGKRWTVRVPLPAGDARGFPLVVEFDHPVPRLEDWPASPVVSTGNTAATGSPVR
jgi:hypothetical protein